jgi:peptidoglycan/LPS O-acetylase OafA/YrhL
VQQLVTKSDEDLGDAGRAVVVGGVALGALVVLREARRAQPDAAVLVLAGIGAPLAAIALAGAATADEPAAWSEASYLLPTLVVAAVVAATAVVESRAP